MSSQLLEQDDKVKMEVLAILLFGLALAAGTPGVTVPFATRLFAEIKAENSNRNVVFSPVSIKSALGLAYMGAEGPTATELYNVLHLSGNTKDEVGAEFSKLLEKSHERHIQLKTANRIYLSNEYTIAPSYNELVSKYFGGVAESVDFAQSASAADKINTWVEEQTNRKIRQMVDPAGIDGGTQAILVNAIYFKANWRYAFRQEKTQELPFHMSKVHSKPVKMMHETMKIPYAELPEMKAKAVELPFSGADIKMLVILPDEVDGLAALEEKLKEVDFTQIEMQADKVNVKFPKFKIEFSTNLNGVLQKLGIKHMFSNADFSSMITTAGKTLSVSYAMHKAFIEVDEHGTEAAAATAMTLGRSFNAARDMSFDFVVDHPFFFAIRDANTVYFAGHVTTF